MKENKLNEEKIDFKEFQKVKLKIATIVKAESVEKSKNLIKIIVDLGTEERQIVAGIKKFYQPEELIGKQVIVVTNLKPAKLMGIKSNGMLLAGDVDGEPIILQPEKHAPPGSPVK